ncbi:MAG: ABC transporter ATP-binding protein [Bacteroidales bacterium]|nr:ABC transporter ATP-binding protein [Bacteroidales bacterium]
MILEASNISRNFGAVRAADNISFTVEEGMAYGILGPNGSGKTTTLGIVLSVLKADSGSFRWFGNKPSPEVYRRIGSLLEVPNFFPYLSLARNLEVIARIKEVPLTDIDRVLEETGLLKRRSSRYFQLSLGMKQRLGIAAALLGDPEVLVLDEPANGLDPEGIAEVRSIVSLQRERGKSIIMASHILDEVEKVCTHVAVLKGGKLITAGKVDELLKGEVLVIASTGDPAALGRAIESSGIASSVVVKETLAEIILNEGYDSAAVNRVAYENGIMLSELKVKKSSLEEQFLELIREK